MMNPCEQFCPNLGCRARGRVGEGNITIHSQKKRRYQCTVCGKTFSAGRGTALYGLKKSAELFVIVVTLLAYGVQGLKTTDNSRRQPVSPRL